MAKVYYVGDWAILTGPVFAESPFNYAHKGLEIFNYGKWLKNALESNGQHQVNSVPSWDFYKLAPGEYEKVLEEYDVIIFSDVEAKLFQLAPSFFDRQKFGKGVLTFPDRIRLTIEAVESGLSVMFLGGWLSFTGASGKGGWGRTNLKEILPVKCLDIEDLIESTEGFCSEVTNEWCKKFEDIDISTMPPIMGYNRTLHREDSEMIMKIKNTEDPLLSYRVHGKGKVLAYTSDPAPHWGCNFVYWKDYNNFWLECLDIITK